jgi:Zn-dependent peptidase ImmA (M78 family)
MIPRPTFDLHPAGHPVLSHAHIDVFASYFIKRYFLRSLNVPKAIKATELMNLSSKEDGLRFEFTDLGTYEGHQRLGRLYIKRKLVLLDNCMRGTRAISLPFVVAHEVAHWILHRDCSIATIRENSAMPDDDDATTEAITLPIDRTPLQWVEWQASALAAAMLIPEVAANLAVNRVHKQIFQTIRQPDVIYNNMTPGNVLEASTKLGLVADMFCVSKTVATIRLKHLKLYEEQAAISPHTDLSSFQTR